MTQQGVLPWPADFTVIRILSQGPGGVVALAMDQAGGLTVLKLLRLVEGRDPEAALLKHRRLLELSDKPGLLPILGCGLSMDRLWLWELLVPVDDSAGVPLTDTGAYQPDNLREVLLREGAVAASRVAEMGIRVLLGLAALHAAGLVHRDVKPANCFLIQRKVVLGDYGLVAPPGEPFDFSGTEGFIPPEGGADQAADLFALGKALYELWTGNDRLEFPSIPQALLDAADWPTKGSALNTVLLKACSSNARDRYAAAGEFAADLAAAGAGKFPPVNRRRFVVASFAVGAGLAGVGSWLATRQPRAVAVWKRVKAWDHIPSYWGPRSLVPDPGRNRLLKLHCDGGECAIHEISLKSWEIRSTVLKPPVNRFEEAVVHPEEGTLWLAENGRGAMWRFDVEKLAFSEVGGGGPSWNEGFRNSAYWNPVTARAGCIGGYGQFRVNGRRWEFDAATRSWIELKGDAAYASPWPRQVPWLMVEPERRLLHLFGGIGNSTGKQGARDAGMKFFNSQFHFLGDLWTLDLGTGNWTQRAPVTALELDRDHSAALLAGSRSVVVVHSVEKNAAAGTPPAVYRFQMDRDVEFTALESQGDIPEGRASGFLTSRGLENELVAFFQDGIYTLSIAG